MNLLNIFKRRSRAERNEHNYRKWLNSYIPKATSQKIDLKCVFTDRSDNNFYILANPAHLTRERANKIEEALTAIDYGVHKNEIITKLTAILETVDAMPWQNMSREKLKEFYTKSKDQINDLLYRFKSIQVDDLIIEAALYFIYIDNENPYIVNPETMQRKRDLIAVDYELRAFFLNSMEQILKGLNDTKS